MIFVCRAFCSARRSARSLAIAGAALQSLLRNPLAEPYLLGVSNGAALGTMLAFVFFTNIEFARPVMASIGAASATFAVYQMAKSRAGMNVERLVLSGVIVTTFLSSIIVLLTSLLDAAKLRSFTFWLLGDLSQATKSGFYLTLVVVILGTIILSSQARALNLMMIGERDAFDFGVEVKRVRLDNFCDGFRARRHFGRGKRFGRLRRFDRAASDSFERRQRQSFRRSVFGNCRSNFCCCGGHDRACRNRAARIARRRDYGIDRRADVYLFA